VDVDEFMKILKQQLYLNGIDADTIIKAEGTDQDNTIYMHHVTDGDAKVSGFYFQTYEL